MPKRDDDISEAVAQGIAKYIHRQKQAIREQEARDAELQEQERVKRLLVSAVVLLACIVAFTIFLIWCSITAPKPNNLIPPKPPAVNPDAANDSPGF